MKRTFNKEQVLAFTDDADDESYKFDIDDGWSDQDSVGSQPESTDDDELEAADPHDGFRTLRPVDKPAIDPSYCSDTDDDEVQNTIGNVPIEWYDEFPHIGYDSSGNKIMRPAQGDDLDAFLATMDDKNAWKSVHDKLHAKDVVLSPDELRMLKQIQLHSFPETTIDPYEPLVEWFSSQQQVLPINAAPEPKSRFVPSKFEASKIMKIARAIRAGLIVPGKVKRNSTKYFDIWGSESDKKDRTEYIAAPKMKLPIHSESYNPPEEYLLTPEEEKAWNELDPEDRQPKVMPKKFPTLRQVPLYSRFIQERFERCLDLYLCPRAIKNKLDIDPESLVPKLPKPQELEPFPNRVAVTYKGHKGRVRGLSVDPTGQWFATCSDDKTVRIWEIISGRCIDQWEFESPILAVAWNPNKRLVLLAASVGTEVMLLIPQNVNKDLKQDTLDTMDKCWDADIVQGRACEWVKPNALERSKGISSFLHFKKNVTSIDWHRKGDYFTTVSPDADSTAVQIHQISTRRSQAPFRKSHGLIQKVLFHPSKPIIFVASQRHVRVYNLSKHELIKKLTPGAKWISSMSIHPNGDNLIVGTYDTRLHWFDMDLSTKPYKTLRHHKSAIREVDFHSRYPLFASCSDDGSILVSHGMVYDDLMRNPLIVPLKTIEAHQVVEHLGSLSCQFHPTEPWIFSCGADGCVKLFT